MSYQTSSKRPRSSRRSLLSFVPCFSACLDLPSPLLSAPGSPRMNTITTIQQISISLFDLNEYSRTSLFRTRLIRSPRYFEGRSNALGFTLPLYVSPVISKPRNFELFFHFPWDFEMAGFECSSFISHKVRYNFMSLSYIPMQFRLQL